MNTHYNNTIIDNSSVEYPDFNLKRKANNDNDHENTTLQLRKRKCPSEYVRTVDITGITKIITESSVAFQQHIIRIVSISLIIDECKQISCVYAGDVCKVISISTGNTCRTFRSLRDGRDKFKLKIPSGAHQSQSRLLLTYQGLEKFLGMHCMSTHAVYAKWIIEFLMPQFRESTHAVL